MGHGGTCLGTLIKPGDSGAQLGTHTLKTIGQVSDPLFPQGRGKFQLCVSIRVAAYPGPAVCPFPLSHAA
eukprot:2096194-Rhodomonas_salina.1